MKKICEVFKSRKKADTYLIVDKQEGMERVPEALRELLGELNSAMVLLVTPEKPFARTSGEQVLKSIEEQGYYLQLPPPQDDEMSAISEKNSKLPRA